IDRYFPDVKCNYVAIDNFKASYSITRHMIENGAKRIGLVTYKSTLLHLQERKKGYTAALKENKLPSKKMWIKEISNGNEKTEIEAAIDQLTSSEESVDAILFASNIISSFGLKFINSLSLKVPEQIMLASFDETEASELFYAPLTYIKQPLEQIGKLATNILLNKINKPNNELIQVKLEAELVTRKSTQRKKTKM
ncbi:MAG TPA: substrate-binding domain-containing protein, partial [Flavisolibacter sp.]|nr:substrate-binding domain-containing protein [Flavisolibacter sp.]